MTQLPAYDSTTPAHASPDRLSNDFAAELFEATSYNAGSFLPRAWSQNGIHQISLSSSQKSLTALKKRSFKEMITLDSDDNVIASSGLVPTSEEVKFSLLSPDGSRLAVFRVIAGKDGSKETKRVIEFYNGKGDRKVDEIEVTKEAGEFYFDSTFGPPTWHPDNQHIVFTAEAPSPKKNDDDEVNARPSADKFRYTPDYGETFTGKKEPTLYLVALSTSPLHSSSLENNTSATKRSRPSIHRLTFPETGGESVNFGQPAFVPSSSNELKLLAAGYSSLGDQRKLGIVYCANRPARIYELVLGHTQDQNDKPTFRAIKVTALSPEDRSARSPRVHVPSSNSSTTAPISAVYLSNRLGGVHSSCASLHLLTFDSSVPGSSWQTSDLVSTVYKPKSVDDFPGIYVDQLPQQPFLSLDSGLQVAFSSIWRSRRVPLVVSLADGAIEPLAPWPKADESNKDLPYLGSERELDSFEVFGTDGEGRVLATRSSMTTVPEVVVVNLGKSRRGRERYKWKVLRKTELSEALESALSKLSSTVLPLPNFLGSEIIYVSPTSIDTSSTSSNPLSLTAHGGPNSTSTTQWSVSTVAMLLAGFNVAFSNYPGSLGFGQDFVDALAPQLGKLDIDATRATKLHLEKLSLSTPGRAKNVYTGGSHGGFIGSWLTARYPGEFGACVMRNPVTDLVSLASSSDIPDWTYTEAALEYSLTSPPSFLAPQVFEKLHDTSPLYRSGQVTTPTLLLVGKSDRRVPPDQARQWFHALKKNKGEDGKPLEVTLLAFENEGHPITNEVENEWVAFEEGMKFLSRHVDF